MMEKMQEEIVYKGHNRTAEMSDILNIERKINEIIEEINRQNEKIRRIKAQMPKEKEICISEGELGLLLSNILVGITECVARDDKEVQIRYVQAYTDGVNDLYQKLMQYVRKEEEKDNAVS